MDFKHDLAKAKQVNRLSSCGWDKEKAGRKGKEKRGGCSTPYPNPHLVTSLVACFSRNLILFGPSL